MENEQTVEGFLKVLSAYIEQAEDVASGLAADLTTLDPDDRSLSTRILQCHVAAARHQALLDLWEALTGKRFGVSFEVPANDDPRWTVEIVTVSRMLSMFFTDGLTRLGRPELMIAKAPTDFADAVQFTLNHVAANSVDEPLVVGQKYAMGIKNMLITAEAEVEIAGVPMIELRPAFANLSFEDSDT